MWYTTLHELCNVSPVNVYVRKWNSEIKKVVKLASLTNIDIVHSKEAFGHSRLAMERNEVVEFSQNKKLHIIFFSV